MASDPAVGDQRRRGPRSSHDDELFERLQSLGILTDPRRLRGAAERSMLRTLAARDRPLSEPEAFVRAHRRLARALEAVTMNGKEPPTLSPRLGPFRRVMTPLVQFVARSIILGQTRTVFKDVRRMYALREVNAEWGSIEHRILRRARMQMEMLSDDIGGSRFGIPLFLLSGAFVSGVLSVTRSVVEPALNSRLLTAVLFLAIVAVLVGIAAVVLQGASIARMRLRLALKAPIDTVYKTIGSTGPPPRDRSFLVAVIALVFFALAVIAIPGGVYLLLHV
jgi:hypothetical protein